MKKVKSSWKRYAVQRKDTKGRWISLPYCHIWATDDAGAHTQFKWRLNQVQKARATNRSSSWRTLKGKARMTDIRLVRLDEEQVRLTKTTTLVSTRRKL